MKPDFADYDEAAGRLLVLLPAYNEEGAIGTVIQDIRTALESQEDVEFDTLVIDGHSTDRTREIARIAGATVLMQPGSGKGQAVRFGLGQLDGHSTVIMMDADGSYAADDVPSLLEEIDNGADVVIGSRLRGIIEPGAISELHLIGNRILSTLASSLFGKWVSDVCSGMWALSSNAVSELHLNSNRFEIEAELFAQACKVGLDISEVPIRFRRRVGKPKLGSLRAGISIAMKLLRKAFLPRRDSVK